MHWSNLNEFLSMGGYGLYVWGSYAATALALAWELVAIARRRRRAQAEVRMLARTHEETAR